MAAEQLRVAPDAIPHLLNAAVHTQHRHPDDSQMPGVGQLHVKTVKKKMLVPVEEVVKVPIVRKEPVKRVERQVVKGQKLIPIKKYREVEETTIEVKEELINGRVEKRAHPVTRMRRVPYMEYIPQEVEIPVDVPIEEVVTHNGHRLDKHIVSKVVEVEEDHVFEMRPVFIKKADVRTRDGGNHHTFKAEHGNAVWDGPVHGSWNGRPITPVHRPELKRLERPTTANSIRSEVGLRGSMAAAAAAQAMNYTNHNKTKLAASSSSGALNRTSEKLRSPNYSRPRTPPSLVAAARSSSTPQLHRK